MDNFIVLGLVPGTNIRISFQAWIIIMVTVTASVAWIVHYRHLRADRQRLSKLQHLRIHASQLHQRAV